MSSSVAGTDISAVVPGKSLLEIHEAIYDILYPLMRIFLLLCLLPLLAVSLGLRIFPHLRQFSAITRH